MSVVFYDTRTNSIHKGVKLIALDPPYDVNGRRRLAYASDPLKQVFCIHPNFLRYEADKPEPPALFLEQYQKYEAEQCYRYGFRDIKDRLTFYCGKDGTHTKHAVFYREEAARIMELDKYFYAPKDKELRAKLHAVRDEQLRLAEVYEHYVAEAARGIRDRVSATRGFDLAGLARIEAEA